MKNLFILIFAATLFSCNCEDDDDPAINACISSDAINEIPWLINLKNSIDNCSCQTSVMKGTYGLQTVYFVLMNDPLCNGIGTIDLFNCKGEPVGTIELAEFAEQGKIDTVLYSCKE